MKPTTSTKPLEYDKSVQKTIPYYEQIHESILDLIQVCKNGPTDWLDVGCGTGELVRKAMQYWPDARYVMIDPNPDMIAVAKEKLSEGDNLQYCISSAETYEAETEKFDVITAVLSHHYLSAEERKKAIANSFKALKLGGVLITCEHSAPRTEKGLEIVLTRWEKYQIAAGKTPEKAAAHIKRYNVEYFPISKREQIRLLEEAGFSCVEILWASYCDVVYYAIK